MNHQCSSISQANRQSLFGRARVNGDANLRPLSSFDREDKASGAALLPQHFGEDGGGIEVINSTELARRLGVPETWVRSRSNPHRTDDPIPHYKFGRYVQFPWGSDVLRAWLNRQLVSTDRAGHSRRNG